LHQVVAKKAGAAGYCNAFARYFRQFILQLVTDIVEIRSDYVLGSDFINL
jgi:hypothetical protein